MVFDIKDKVVLITGAAIGIGAAAVEAFLAEGAKHVAALDIAENPGLALEKELNTKYGGNKIKFIKCDVTNEDELLHAFDITLKTHGYIDVVINNAGVMNDSEKMYRKEIEIIITAVTISTLKAYSLMRKDKGGKGGTVINISSTVALQQSSIFPIYFGTKSFVLQFSNCIGREEVFSRTGLRVLTVCFGATNTTLFNKSKWCSIDEHFDKEAASAIEFCPIQKTESAIIGILEAFKHGASGSTWVATEDRPPMDITSRVKKAYEILSESFVTV